MSRGNLPALPASAPVQPLHTACEPSVGLSWGVPPTLGLQSGAVGPLTHSPKAELGKGFRGAFIPFAVPFSPPPQPH